MSSNDAHHKAVWDEIDKRRDDAVMLLQELVSVPSITGSEAEVQEHVERMFQARGMTIDQWVATREEIEPYFLHVGDQPAYLNRPNLLATHTGTGGGKSIMLNAHMDVVDPGDPSLWKHDPFGAQVEGDLLYGRGSCDMKAGLISEVLALDAIRAAGLKLRGDVKISSTVGEEDGGLGALSTMLRGHRADAAVITEPTRMALIPSHAGSLVCRITVHGKAAHGAARNSGVSALEKFIPLHQDLIAWEGERNASLTQPLFADLENKIPISFGMIRSGEWHSTVPESLVAEGRIGLLPGEDMHEFMEEVRQRLMNKANEDEWMREHPPELEWISGQFAPSETPVDAPISQSVIAAHQRVTGEAPSIEGAPYGADMRLFTIFGDMPCVMYGAGDVGVAHQTDEHISITDMLTASKTLASLMIDWCEVDD